MNERIRELAKQAGFENGHQDRNGNSLSYELEKLAELIVKECADIATINSHQWEPPGYYVKKHFGIE